MPHLFWWQAITLYGLAVAIKTNLRFRPKLYSKIIDKNLFWFWAKMTKKMFDRFRSLEMWSRKSEMDMLSRFIVAIWWCAQIVLILSIKCIRCVVDSTKKDFDKISEFLILSIIIIIKSFDQTSKFIGKCQEINEDMSPP